MKIREPMLAESIDTAPASLPSLYETGDGPSSERKLTMPYKTGNATHDANVQAAELTYQNAAAGGFANQAAAKTADINRLTSIINSGAANGISVVNEQTALHSLMTTGNA
jgi:hypothetical protein